MDEREIAGRNSNTEIQDKRKKKKRSKTKSVHRKSGFRAYRGSVLEKHILQFRNISRSSAHRITLVENNRALANALEITKKELRIFQEAHVKYVSEQQSRYVELRKEYEDREKNIMNQVSSKLFEVVDLMAKFSNAGNFGQTTDIECSDPSKRKSIKHRKSGRISVNTLEVGVSNQQTSEVDGVRQNRRLPDLCSKTAFDMSVILEQSDMVVDDNEELSTGAQAANQSSNISPLIREVMIPDIFINTRRKVRRESYSGSGPRKTRARRHVQSTGVLTSVNENLSNSTDLLSCDEITPSVTPDFNENTPVPDNFTKLSGADHSELCTPHLVDGCSTYTSNPLLDSIPKTNSSSKLRRQTFVITQSKQTSDLGSPGVVEKIFGQKRLRPWKSACHLETPVSRNSTQESLKRAPTYCQVLSTVNISPSTSCGSPSLEPANEEETAAVSGDHDSTYTIEEEPCKSTADTPESVEFYFPAMYQTEECRPRTSILMSSRKTLCLRNSTAKRVSFIISREPTVVDVGKLSDDDDQAIEENDEIKESDSEDFRPAHKDAVPRDSKVVRKTSRHCKPSAKKQETNFAFFNTKKKAKSSTKPSQRGRKKKAVVTAEREKTGNPDSPYSPSNISGDLSKNVDEGSKNYDVKSAEASDNTHLVESAVILPKRRFTSEIEENKTDYFPPEEEDENDAVNTSEDKTLEISSDFINTFSLTDAASLHLSLDENPKAGPDDCTDIPSDIPVTRVATKETINVYQDVIEKESEEAPFDVEETEDENIEPKTGTKTKGTAKKVKEGRKPSRPRCVKKIQEQFSETVSVTDYEGHEHDTRTPSVANRTSKRSVLLPYKTPLDYKSSKDIATIQSSRSISIIDSLPSTASKPTTDSKPSTATKRRGRPPKNRPLAESTNTTPSYRKRTVSPTALMLEKTKERMLGYVEKLSASSQSPSADLKRKMTDCDSRSVPAKNFQLDSSPKTNIRKPRRAAAQRTTYKEPTLNSKLRRGDNFGVGWKRRENLQEASDPPD